jgi:hypothetical protein
VGGGYFEQLDFIYSPARDVAAESDYFAHVLRGRVAFRIEGMGARVAMIELAQGPPHLLLADHLDGERPILIYRVADLARAVADLDAHGWGPARAVEIPMGPCRSFVTPGGHRLALYQLTRPDVARHFEGRHDF